MRPRVHARLHGLETPPRVCWPSFQSASQRSPCSLVEDGHVLLFHVLAGIAHRYWHVGSLYFGACVRGNAVKELRRFNFQEREMTLNFSDSYRKRELRKTKRKTSPCSFTRILFSRYVRLEESLKYANQQQQQQQQSLPVAHVKWE